MHQLPKVNPVCEHVPACWITLSELLEKLVRGEFNGYLSFEAIDCQVACIFVKGRLIYASGTEKTDSPSGLEAVTGMFEKITKGSGEISIYRLTPDLAVCSQALLQENRLIGGIEVARTDLRAMLAQLKERGLNGVVRFFAEDRQALIFFSKGVPVGFHHDDARTIETSPDESRRIAALPGARLDVFATRSLAELIREDLLALVHPGIIEDTARTTAARAGEGQGPDGTQRNGLQPGKLGSLLADLQEVAMAYLSREGRQIITNRLEEAGGLAILQDAGKTACFLSLVEQDALLIDTDEHVAEMISLMKTEIAGRHDP